jgi:hypothetical protein
MGFSLDPPTTYAKAILPDGSKVIEIAWLDPANRKYSWIALGIIAALPFVFWGARAFFVFLWFPAGYGVLLTLCNTTRLTVGPQRIHWKHGPVPSMRGRALRRDEAEAVVYGQVLLKVQRHNRTPEAPRYATGIRKTNGKIWWIFDDLRTLELAKSLADATAAHLNGLRTIQCEMPRTSRLTTFITVLLLIAGGLAALGVQWLEGFPE